MVNVDRSCAIYIRFINNFFQVVASARSGAVLTISQKSTLKIQTFLAF
jgi:hypothetical protein